MSPKLVLVGPPGSGKTTVGNLLAELLGVTFRDTDSDIAKLAGSTIPDIFLDHGEDHFRALERQAVAAAVAQHDGVLALGGGAILAPENRAVLAEVPVAFLSVELTAAVSRVGLGAGRPLLAVNPRATMKALLEQRRPLYAEVADLTISTDGVKPAEVAERLAHWLGGPVRITIGGDQPYEVLIGPDVTMALPDHLAGASRAAILYAPPLSEHARRIATFIEDTVSTVLVEVPDAEAGKTVEVAQSCWDRLGEAGFTRNDVILGVGGGAVTDLAGFVAACWLRGVRVIQLPTSVLGMVDAAVGGKTGVNTRSGKNLVGAFHTPTAVLCDLTVLESLPPRDRVAGMAEIVKCGFIADTAILDIVEADPSRVVEPGSAALADLIRRAIQVKADVVSQDLRESGLRAILNYGHTFGHAIEKVENYRWRHGDAVAVGMVYAAVLGRMTGRVDLVEQTRTILRGIGLPTAYSAGHWDELLAAMRVDKKAVGDTLRFVLLEAPGKPVVVDDVTIEQLRAAYSEVSA